MRSNSWLWATSAALNLLAVLFPFQLGWCMLPAFGCVLQALFFQRAPFGALFCWVAATLGSTAVPAFYAVFYLGSGVWWHRLLLILVPSLLAVLIITLLFWGTTQIAFLVAQQRTLFFCGCVTSLWLYYMVIMHGLLLPFGALEGYPPGNPLLPLVANPNFLFFVPQLGGAGGLLAVLLVFGMAVWCLPKIIICLLQALLIISWFVAPLLQVPEPVWLQQLAVVQRKFPLSNDIMGVAEELRTVIDIAMQQQPAITTILLPESSLEDPHMLSASQLRAVWSGVQTARGDPITLIGGGFRYDGPCYRNSIYYIQGEQLHFYDKQHAMPLVERSCWPCLAAVMEPLYFYRAPAIHAAQTTRPCWDVATSPMSPYICSELFMGLAESTAQVDVLIAVCNDAWALFPTQQLMLLAARYQALVRARDVLYVGYTYAALLTKNGSVLPLKYVLK